MIRRGLKRDYLNGLQESAWYKVDLSAIQSQVIREKFVQLEKGGVFPFPSLFLKRLILVFGFKSDADASILFRFFFFPAYKTAFYLNTGKLKRHR